MKAFRQFLIELTNAKIVSLGKILRKSANAKLKQLTKDQLIAYKGKEFKRQNQRRKKTLSTRELINLKNIPTDRRKGERRYGRYNEIF